jgi:hypothetical protein
MSQSETIRETEYTLTIKSRRIVAERSAYPIPGFGNTDRESCTINLRSYQYESKGAMSDAVERQRTYYKRNGIPATWWHNGTESDTHEHSDEDVAPGAIWDEAGRITKDSALSLQEKVHCLFALVHEGIMYPDCIAAARKEIERNEEGV